MATKAQWAKYHAERSGRKKEKSPRVRRDFPVDTALPGVSATDRRAGGGSSAARNRSARAGRRAAYALEDSAGRPSRKSTRKSANAQKPSHALRRAKTRR